LSEQNPGLAPGFLFGDLTIHGSWMFDLARYFSGLIFFEILSQPLPKNFPKPWRAHRGRGASGH
jgi:hypothetical protein